MKQFEKCIKYAATALALVLACCIIGGIVGVLGLLNGLIDRDKVADDSKLYSISSNITALDVEIGAADFVIKQGDAFSVESNLKHLTVKEKNGVLKMEENSNFGGNYNDAALTLYIPANMVFEKAEIVTGAGRLTVDELSAKTLELELGAGEVNIQSLYALHAADIDGGAGKVTISGGALHDLDFDMGIGELELVSAISGRSEMDLGIGESNITLIGDRNDYVIDVEKGIGSLTVDGKQVTDFGNSGTGENSLRISGGIGQINLSFDTP